MCPPLFVPSTYVVGVAIVVVDDDDDDDDGAVDA